MELGDTESENDEHDGWYFYQTVYFDGLSLSPDFSHCDLGKQLVSYTSRAKFGTQKSNKYILYHSMQNC